MKIQYNPETDSLVIELRSAPIRESDEVTPNVIADFGWDGEVVGFEILRASMIVEELGDVTLERFIEPTPAP